MTELVIASQLAADLNRRIEARTTGVRVVDVGPGVPRVLPAAARVLIARPQFGSHVQGAPKPAGWPFGLEWIQLVSVGADAYPRWLFDDVPVSCARGTSSRPIAEFVLALILAASKRLPDIWIDAASDWAPRQLTMVGGSTLGIVGFGAVAATLAPLALGLGMRVLATRRTDTPLGVPGVERATLDDGRVGLASLDVTDPEPLPAGHPLYAHPQVRLSPHTSVFTDQTRTSLVKKFTDNLARHRRGAALLDVVDPDRGY